MKKYHIITIGCQMNKSDSERVASYLEDLGMELADKDIKADLVVINTCGVRQSAEDRIYGLVGKIKKKNKNIKIVLTGCLAERTDVRKKLAKNVDIWMPIDDLVGLRERLGEIGGAGEVFEGSLKTANPLGRRKRTSGYLKVKPKYQSKISAFVPIGNGCNNFCAYCVVPFARGPEIYRPKTEILSEVKNLLKKGFKEINLIAQNVNSYACPETKIDFADLLLEVNDLEGYFWLRFSTSHPKDMSRKLIKTMPKCEKLCEHLHLPAQAGSDKIIKAMNRHYTADHYRNLIKNYRAEYNKKRKKADDWMPEPGLTTDIIVGFPGETKKDFNYTAKLFRELKFDMAFIAQYSPRPGTSAFKMKDDVSSEEKKRREEELMKILRKTSLENNKKYLEKEIEVLVESEGKRGELIGRTRTNKVIKIKRFNRFLKTVEPLKRSFIRVKIKKVKDFGMEGEIILSRKAVVIVGTTASGKTNLAVDLAYKFSGEVISADSRQVYKGMDIGTGKDLDEYQVKIKNQSRGFGTKIKIVNHLIDVVGPKTEFSLADFKKRADKALVDIWNRRKLPIIAGGTGLYAQALVDDFDLDEVKPDKKLRAKLEKLTANELFIKLKKENKDLAESLNESERKNKRRLIRKLEVSRKLKVESKKLVKKKKDCDFLIIGLTWPKEILEKNIYKRIIDRLDNEDMVGEVERLNKEGVSWKRLEDFGLEYKFIALYLQGKLKYDEMIEQLFIATRQFAKRQITWLKRWESQGTKIHWFCEDDLSKFEDVKKEVERMAGEFLG